MLVITNNPERASFRQRIGVYVDLLRSKGIECEIATLPEGFVARHRLFRRSGEFDGVFLHKKGLNPVDAFWLRKYGPRVIFNYDDAIMFSHKRPDRFSGSHFFRFRRSVGLSNMVIVGSSYLADFAGSISDNVKVLPLGLDVSDYGKVSEGQDDGKVRLVWVGSRSTLSYLEEISDVIEEIGKKYSNVVLRIVGDDFLDFDNMAVEKRQWSKETRSGDLGSCDIGLAPLPDNPFTRGKCSFKVLEYSASGLAVVASPVGTNQVHVVEGETGFLVDSKEQWFERISQLIDDERLRERMGDAGIKHACKSDISVTGQRFVELIKECLGKRVLVISNNPNRASFRQRIGVYIDGLRAKGVLVDVVKLPSNQLSRFRLFKNCAYYDAVFVHKKRFNPFDARVFGHYARKVIYDFDDAIMYDDKRPDRVGGKRGRDFSRTAKLADVVIAGNDYLAAHAGRYTDNIHVLPTGLNVGDYEVQSLRGDDGKVRLVWIGSRSTLMYLEGIREVLEEVGRRFDNVVLRIICDAFFEMENMEVEKVEWSLERQGECLCESDIGLAPLPDNKFTRGKCGFKILQYAAAGLPVVASGVGVNREFTKDGVRGFLAGSSSQWIEKLAELIENKDLRRQMGDAGREWVKRFDLSVLGKKISRIILQDDKVL